MDDISQVLAEWKEGMITRDQLWRRLLEFDCWKPPENEDCPSEAFAPLEPAMLRATVTGDGQLRYALCSCWDASEAYIAQHGPTGFGDRTGWEIFAVALPDNTAAVVIDPGMPHEFTIPAADLPALKELADAVAVEEAWQRLRTGDEVEGDVARVARYPAYLLAAVQREGGDVLIFAPHPSGDGRQLVPIFTHPDALALALDEFRETFAPAGVKILKLSGAQAFPVLAEQPEADGIVFNFRGPGEPMAFQLDVTDIMLAELAKS